MRAEVIGGIGIVAVLLFLGFVAGIGAGGCAQKKDSDRQWQADAAKRGFGSFVITDSLSGATEFQWRKP